MTATLTPAERDLIRRVFGAGWGEPRPLSAGIWLRRWASGPRKGAPKLPKTVQTMFDRGLVAIDGPFRTPKISWGNGMAGLLTSTAARGATKRLHRGSVPVLPAFRRTAFSSRTIAAATAPIACPEILGAAELGGMRRGQAVALGAVIDTFPLGVRTKLIDLAVGAGSIPQFRTDRASGTRAAQAVLPAGVGFTSASSPGSQPQTV